MGRKGMVSISNKITSIETPKIVDGWKQKFMSSMVSVHSINITPNRRTLNDQRVAELMESIRANGLLNPITVDQNLNLIAGLHRLTACKLLGLQQIECHIILCENRDIARLAEIDENLIRSELDALERSELWLERDQILERMGLRAKAGDNQFSRKGSESISQAVKTTLELAQQTGYTDRTFQYGKQIAKNIDAEVKQLIKGTPVAKSTSALLKVARAGSKQRQQAEEAEQQLRKANEEKNQAELQQQANLAAKARSEQKKLQLIAFQNTMAEKEAKQASKEVQTKTKPCLTEQIQAKVGDEWILGQHLIYCGDTTSKNFIQLLPSNAALAIASTCCVWQHDYLVDEADVVAVMRSQGAIYNLCKLTTMPFRFELLLDNIYVAIYSRKALDKLVSSPRIEGVEGIVAYLISLYTQPGSFVITPSLGNGEVPITCERLKRVCFAGDDNPQRVNRAIARWQGWTKKQAQKTL
jgi:ParB family chromosome partitioning protein